MSEMLSQAEIEALMSDDETDDTSAGGAGVANADDFLSGDDPGDLFTHEEIDAIGEIGNISMGNSATTLFTLLNHKVNITTPKVTVSTMTKIAETYSAPLVVVKVEYTEGLLGSNLLVLKESDVMIITDLMMGGDGTNVQGEITDLHLSAISEAMNQMIGTSSTSLSNVFDKKIDISPPSAVSVKLDSAETLKSIGGMDPDEKLTVVSFDMTVEDILETKLMQIQPYKFAKDMIANLMRANDPNSNSAAQQAQTPAAAAPMQAQQQMPPYQAQQPQYAQPPQYPQQPPQGQPYPYGAQPVPQQYVNVQPANFQSFDDDVMTFDRKNIGLVMDVQLEISVELGRTHRLIKDILDFGQGSIIELDKLAGEPVDVLVNGKMIAKGEVVVIDESFGVRVVDIIHPSKRL
jgi:flagellar motor switch protein FliN/FliY